MRDPPTLAGVSMTYNCANGEWDWQICQDQETITTSQLKAIIDSLIHNRKDLTSFVITAAIRRTTHGLHHENDDAF
jgi:hypothetical protein